MNSKENAGGAYLMTVIVLFQMRTCVSPNCLFHVLIISHWAQFSPWLEFSRGPWASSDMGRLQDGSVSASWSLPTCKTDSKGCPRSRAGLIQDCRLPSSTPNPLRLSLTSFVDLTSIHCLQRLLNSPSSSQVCSLQPDSLIVHSAL